MAAGKAALAFATGFGGGYMGAKRQAEQDEERRQDRESAKKVRDIQLRQMQQQEADQIALRQAGAPASVVTANDVMNDDDGNAMPAAPRFEVAAPGQTGRRFETQAEAAAAAAQHNDPVALANRMGSALMAQGKPVESMQLQQHIQKFADEHWNRRLREAVGQGHEGLARLVTDSESGIFKGKTVKAVPSPDGKTTTYVAVGPDGKETPTGLTFPNDENGVITAAYRLDKAVPVETRYRHMVEADKRAAQNALKERELDLKDRQLTEFTGPLALARAEAARAQGEAALARAERAGSGGGQKVDAEDRKRWTSLHGEAGRRLSETRKEIARLQADPAFMVRARKPGTPEAAQLAGMNEEVMQYKEDRDIYASLLGGEKAQAARGAREGARDRSTETTANATPADRQSGGGSPADAAAPARPPARSKVAAPTDEASYAALPPGTKYQHPNDPPGTYRTKK